MKLSKDNINSIVSLRTGHIYIKDHNNKDLIHISTFFIDGNVNKRELIIYKYDSQGNSKMIKRFIMDEDVSDKPMSYGKSPIPEYIHNRYKKIVRYF